MKPFHYLCLGAILSSLLHELVPLSTLRLLEDSSRTAINDDNDSDTTTSIHIQRKHTSGLKSDDDNDDDDNDDTTKNRKRTPKLGDGCYHIFLDVGSNIGVTGRMLLEPHLYPPLHLQERGKHAQKQQQQQQQRRRLRKRTSKNAHITKNNADKSNQYKFTSARQFFTSQFGPESIRIPTEYCIFAFEPNPIHAGRQLELQSAYSAMGWRYHYIQAGVSDTNGSMTFYHVGTGDKLLERGFTTVESKCRTSSRQQKKECPSEQVLVHRLSDWIEKEIHGRILPVIPTSAASSSITATATSTNTAQTSLPLPPKVVMKMDIEMAEWLVLPDLLTSGVLCRDIDAMLAEFHTGGRHENEYPIHFVSQPQEARQQTSGGGGGGGGNNSNTTNAISWTLKTHLDAEQLKNEMLNMIHRNPNCKTLVVEGDDESYGRDGMPLPSSSASPEEKNGHP